MGAYYIADGVFIQCLVMGTIMAFVFLHLYKRNLFHWLSPGFWAWSAFTLYFFLTPLSQYLGGPSLLEKRILLTEGWPRMVWVTFFVAVGISMFFWGFFRCRPGKPRFGIGQQAWPPGIKIIIILSLLAGVYSLMTYRGAFGTERADRGIVASKHVGDVTGYETAFYYFANFSIVYLIFNRRTRILGLALMCLFIVGKLEDRSDRFSAVSLFLAVTMVMTLGRRRKWPSSMWIAAVLVFVLFMQARGHSTFSEFRQSGRWTMQHSRAEVKRGEGAQMLSGLYLSSYVHDKAGYTYGIPVVSGLLFGYLPRKYFPWKDWMVEGRFGTLWRAFALEPEMYGTKSTVIGDLYGNGGVFAVAGGMFILGFLTRKLDGWLAPQAPLAVRAMGVVWLSCLWMMIGSSLLWCAAGLWINAVPFVGVVICSKIFGPAARRSLPAPKYLLQR